MKRGNFWGKELRCTKDEKEIYKRRFKEHKQWKRDSLEGNLCIKNEKFHSSVTLCRGKIKCELYGTSTEKETASNNKKCVLLKKNICFWQCMPLFYILRKECNISLCARDTGKGGFDRITLNCWYLYCLHFYIHLFLCAFSLYLL